MSFIVKEITIKYNKATDVCHARIITDKVVYMICAGYGTNRASCIGAYCPDDPKMMELIEFLDHDILRVDLIAPYVEYREKGGCYVMDVSPNSSIGNELIVRLLMHLPKVNPSSVKY